MKAIVCTSYGSPDALRLMELPTPSPSDNEVLVKVHAATVTAGDVMMRRVRFPLSLALSVFGYPRKRIPGHEFAGDSGDWICGVAVSGG